LSAPGVLRAAAEGVGVRVRGGPQDDASAHGGRAAGQALGVVPPMDDPIASEVQLHATGGMHHRAARPDESAAGGSGMV
jgi:hypothetical protein